MKLTLANNLLRKESKLPISLEKFVQFTATCVWFAAFGCYWYLISSRHQRLVQEIFFKNEISENISQKFHDQWKIA